MSLTRTAHGKWQAVFDWEGLVDKVSKEELFSANCERQSYGVCCGQTEDQLQAICVLTGNHIPDEFFGDLNP